MKKTNPVILRFLKDKMTFILDRNGMKADKTAFNFAREILPILQKHYPEKMSRITIFPKNSLMSMLLKMFSVALKPETVNRIHLKSDAESLKEIINLDNILERYGGTLREPNHSDSTENMLPALEIDKSVDVPALERAISQEIEAEIISHQIQDESPSKNSIISKESPNSDSSFTEINSSLLSLESLEIKNRKKIFGKTNQPALPNDSIDREEIWSAPEDVLE